MILSADILWSRLASYTFLNSKLLGSKKRPLKGGGGEAAAARVCSFLFGLGLSFGQLPGVFVGVIYFYLLLFGKKEVV